MINEYTKLSKIQGKNKGIQILIESTKLFKI